MRYIYKIAFLLSLLIFSFRGIAQQENTLYFMERIPQSQYLNPANHPDCKWWLSGLIIPTWVVPMVDFPIIHFPIYMDVSSPFALNDVVLYKNNKPDKTFLYDATTQNAFIKKLSPINYVSNNFSLEWLNLGFKQGKNYWDLSIMTKYNVNYSFPKEYFAFPLNGNLDSSRATNGIFDGQGINANLYQEASIGFNRQFSRYFRVGLRIKGIMGIANLNTASSKMKLNTIQRTDNELSQSKDAYLPLTIESQSDMRINASLPLVMIENDTNNIPKSFDLKKGISAKDFMKLKNYGWGVDFGFIKDWSSEFTVYGSVIDFGFINWKSDVHNYSLSGKYNFNGQPLSNLNIININLDTLLKEFTNGYKAKDTAKSYVTSLNTKYFFGGNYKFSKKVNVGLVGRMEKMPYNYEYSATASLNLKPFRWGTLTLSSSYYKKSFYNFGLGYTIRIMAMQWYAIYDNLIGAVALPEKTRYFSLRWGVNLVFGRGKKKFVDKNKPLLITL